MSGAHVFINPRLLQILDEIRYAPKKAKQAVKQLPPEDEANMAMQYRPIEGGGKLEMEVNGDTGPQGVVEVRSGRGSGGSGSEEGLSTKMASVGNFDGDLEIA